MTSLIDKYGRFIHYLRISLTDRCNMRCFYCLPFGSGDFVHSDELLGAHELGQIVEAMAARGLRKVRLTGGEPLLRGDVVEIAERISGIRGIVDLNLSTNAMLLEKKAVSLKRAGVGRVNISLDSLDPIKFARVTGTSTHAKVLRGIYAALEAGLTPVKINIVALPDLDVHDLEQFVLWATHHKVHLRFIEEMPFGDADAEGPTNSGLRTKMETITGPLEAVHHDPLSNLVQPYRIPGEDWHITFISPMSAPFCQACNRVRLTSRGFLKLCLDEDLGIDLKPMVRGGMSTPDLGNVIAQSIFHDKPERHHFTDPDFSRAGRAMARTGG